jgi:hypothetical protein
MLDVKLTRDALLLIQRGVLYLFGRDKFFRPCVIFDIGAGVEVEKSNPEVCTPENFVMALSFLRNFVEKTMKLEGYVDQWISIFYFNELSVTQMPRNAILTLCQVAMDHYIYTMKYIFYIGMSWGQNAAYHSFFKYIIDEETREKTICTRQHGDPLLNQLFHPSQLEQRFGGEAPSPENYWPPHIGHSFLPEETDDTAPREFIPDSDYLKILRENPELPCHPHFLEQAGQTSNRDFRLAAANEPSQAECVEAAPVIVT